MGDELRRISEHHGFSYYVSYERGSGADHEGYVNPLSGVRRAMRNQPVLQARGRRMPAILHACFT